MGFAIIKYNEKLLNNSYNNYNKYVASDAIRKSAENLMDSSVYVNSINIIFMLKTFL